MNETRKPALGDMPAAYCNRRGFSAEKRVHFGPPLLKKRLTEIPRELEVSLSLLKKKLRPYLEN